MLVSFIQVLVDAFFVVEMLLVTLEHYQNLVRYKVTQAERTSRNSAGFRMEADLLVDQESTLAFLIISWWRRLSNGDLDPCEVVTIEGPLLKLFQSNRINDPE